MARSAFSSHRQLNAMHEWQVQARVFTATVMRFLNTTKYPPSLEYLLMTLGPAAALCAFADRIHGAVRDVLVMFGRVPFAFYLAHLYLIHALSVMLGVSLAAVLSSNLFFVASCTGITWVSIPALKHIGGKYMARGEAPDRYMEVIVSIPDPAVPGQRKVKAVTLGSLQEFQREHPDHSFVIPARSGEIRRNGTSISYRATALGADAVRVETDTRYDDPFGSGFLGSYEASEREVRPIYSNATVVLENFMLGVAGAGTLSLIGSIMKWVQRRRQQRDQPSA